MIFKKGDRDNLNNYRGITLTCTAYKIFAGILNERIIKEVEGKRGWEETQAGIRRKRGCMDNVCVLKQAIDRRIRKERSKFFALFIDLRAAFDKLDREILWRMGDLEINQGLIDRVKLLYRETSCRVRVGNMLSKKFWVEKG